MDKYVPAEIIVSLLSGIFSSALFLIVLSFLKPRIKICKKISCIYDRVEGRDKQMYYFKIVNTSWLFRVYDIQVRAFACETIPSSNGEDESFNAIELRKDYQWVLNRFNRRHTLQDLRFGDNRISTRTDYAAQFSTSENLKSMLSQKKYITFQVLAKHALTGFSIVKTAKFKHVSNIKDGRFLSGNSFVISV